MENNKKMKKYLVILLALLFMTAPAYSDYAVNSTVSKGSLLKTYKDISYKPMTINKLKNSSKNLDEDSKSVIKKYVYGAVKGEDTFLLINGYLRGNLNSYISKKDITKSLEQRLNYYSVGLKTAIAKVKLQKNMLLYKGLDEKELQTYFAAQNINTSSLSKVSDSNVAELKKKLQGVSFVDKGFMTVSYDKYFTTRTKYKFEIRAPKGMQAILTDGISGKNMKELIINSGYKWQVVDVKKGYDLNRKEHYYNIVLKYTT